MADAAPVLSIDAARAETADEVRPPEIALTVMPGELVLIDARESTQVQWLADLCCGLVPLAAGSVRFLGRDWARVPPVFAAALRGRIGRIFSDGGWIGFLDIAANILLPQLHHTRRDRRRLHDEATMLAAAFGLPGLPLDRPAELAPQDLARAACVRAFLGEPSLLLLESPVGGRFADLLMPLLNAVAAARSRGAAVVWLSRSDLVWRDQSIPADQRWRLGDHRLMPVRPAA
jgi:phospholipid/cholesterol/gamma-HCH transport system ATP-binding protein